MPQEGAGERRERRSTAAPADVSTVNVYLLMEEAHAKLQMLNYEAGYLAPGGHAPFSRTHFALPPASSDDAPLFPQFLEIVVWLFALCRREVEVDIYDDPMTSVNKIVFELRSLGCPVEFQPAKLKTGYGEAAVQVLNFLCDQGLAAESVTFLQPVYPDEDLGDIAVVNSSEAEVGEEVGESKRGGARHHADDDEDDDEMDYAQMMAADQASSKLDDSMGGDALNLSASYQRRKVDPVAWKAELERVGPKLRVSFAALGKEWRAHMHQTQQHEQVLSTLLPTSREQLMSIRESTASALARVEQKEKFMNSQYSELAEQYRSLQTKVRERCSFFGYMTELSTHFRTIRMMIYILCLGP